MNSSICGYETEIGASTLKVPNMSRRLQISAAAFSLLVVLAVFLLPASGTPAMMQRGKQIGAHIVRLHASTMATVPVTTAAFVAMFLWVGATVIRLRTRAASDLLRQTCALRC